MKIEHIVVGTGGAELDDECDDSILTDKINEENLKEDSKIHFLKLSSSEIEYSENDENKQIVSTKNNGFLHCKFSAKKIKMKFIISSPLSSPLSSLLLSPSSLPEYLQKSKSSSKKRRHSIGGKKNNKKEKKNNNKTKKV